MTIEVTIHNKDGRHPIEVASVEHDKRARTSSESTAHKIAPGLSATFYVHLLRDLVIREVHPDYRWESVAKADHDAGNPPVVFAPYR